MAKRLALLLAFVPLGVAIAAALLFEDSDSQATGNSTNFMVDAAGYGDDSSIAIGADGLPVISYRSYNISTGYSSLHVAHCGSVDCSSGNTTTPVDSVDYAGFETSIAIGADGLPIVSYRAGALGDSDLRIAHCGNVSCSSGNVITTVDSAGEVGNWTSITVGPDGLPVVSYSDYTNNALKVAHCGNVTCNAGNTIQTVDSSAGGLSTSIAIGSDRLPVISFSTQGNSDLKVGHCGDLLCSTGNTITTVDSASTVYDGTSISIGTDGLPLIAYKSNFPSSSLMIVHCGNVLCNSSNTITPVGNAGGYVSSAIGADGLPVISLISDSLKLVHCGTADCSLGNATISLDNATYHKAAVAIGTDGLPIISYPRGVQLRAAHCGDVACGGLKPTATPTATATPSGYDPAVTSLTMPSGGTIYHNQGQTKKVAGTIQNLGTHPDVFTVTLRVSYNFDFEADWIGQPGDSVQNGVFCGSSCDYGSFYGQLTYTETASPGQSKDVSRNLFLSCPAPNFTFLQTYFVRLSVSSSSGLDDNASNSSMIGSQSVLCTDSTPTPSTPTPTPVPVGGITSLSYIDGTGETVTAGRNYAAMAMLLLGGAAAVLMLAGTWWHRRRDRG